METVAVEIRDLVRRFGDVTAVDRVSFAVPSGGILTLLGPSGCGKSTTLRCIAGLEPCDGGEILIGGEVVSSAAKRILVPPERRRLGMVPQSYAIWPHMTLAENVTYGLRVRRQPRDVIARKLRETLRLVRLDGLEHRYAAELSGGQQQRVALARALIYDPTVILLDEPLSNLDAKLRESTRDELMELQSRLRITMIFVTHDQQEALVVSDRVAVMNLGRIEHLGTPAEIYGAPQTRFVASFIGRSNFLRGVSAAGSRAGEQSRVVLEDGRTRWTCRAQSDVREGTPVIVAVKAEQFEVVQPPVADPDGLLTAVTKDVIFTGTLYQLRARSGATDLVVHTIAPPTVAGGDIVHLRPLPGAALAFEERQDA